MIWPTPEDYKRVPEIMRHPTVKRWVVFRCTPLTDGTVGKLPLTPNGKYASIIDTRTWSAFDECITAMRWCVGNAVGFALGSDYKLACVDLDKCIMPDGSISATARKYIDRLAPAEPYIERSISGRGLHIMVWYSGKKPEVRPEPGVELFTEERFIVLTGVPA